MSSTDRFKPPGKVTSGDIYEVFRSKDEWVLNTSDFDDNIDWASRSTVRRQLDEMLKSGEIHSKQAGKGENSGLVWYPSDKIREVPQPTPDPIKLIYRNPWFSTFIIGLLIIGFGFILFMPGLINNGPVLGIVNPRAMINAGVVFYVIGVGTALGGAVMFANRQFITAIRNRNTPN